jgi:hypothetical protein
MIFILTADDEMNLILLRLKNFFDTTASELIIQLSGQAVKGHAVQGHGQHILSTS